MADNILRLRVDSQEYDAKLKKAAEGVRHLADVAHQSAGDMTGLDKSTLDYIKSIGEMETKSRTAAGSVRELESTYKELKVIYDQLNEVEKGPRRNLTPPANHLTTMGNPPSSLEASSNHWQVSSPSTSTL